MRDIDRRDLKLMMKMLDLGTGRDAKLGVEIRQRFIHQKDVWLAHNGAGQRHPLPLATGQGRRAAVQEFGQLDHFGGAAHALIMRCRIDLPDLQRKADILIDIHVRIEAIGLKDHRDIAVLRLKVIDHLPVNLDIAGGNLLEAGNHPHRRRLATA